jgi:hypothetical protein
VTDAEVEIFYKNKQVLFKAGSRLEMASSAGPNGYESWTPDRVINLPDAARKIFKLSAPYLNSNVDRAEASAVCLKQGYGVIATDTVSMLGFFGSAPTEDLLIPARVAKALGESGALAIGDRGVGAAYDHGYLYEPLSSALKDYPFPMSKKSLETARQAETLAKAKVSELRDAVNAGKEFLLDKTDLGLLVSEDEALVLTIPMSTGAYRRRVAAEVLSPLAETRWSVKPPLAWLEWATAIDAEGEIEVARIEGALALRFRYGKRSSILLTSDL